MENLIEWTGYALSLFLSLLAFFLVSWKGKILIGTGIALLFIMPFFVPEVVSVKFLIYARILFSGICYLYVRRKRIRIP